MSLLSTRFQGTDTIRAEIHCKDSASPPVLSHFVALDRPPDRLRGPERQYLPAINRGGRQVGGRRPERSSCQAQTLASTRNSSAAWKITGVPDRPLQLHGHPRAPAVRRYRVFPHESGRYPFLKSAVNRRRRLVAIPVPPEGSGIHLSSLSEKAGPPQCGGDCSRSNSSTPWPARSTTR